jgi:hypothetical protein
MKSLRRMLPIVLLSLSTVAFAQTDAQKSFDTLKTLQGSWQGTLDGKPLNGQVTMRVTSMGNTLMHEMKSVDRPDDPISMFHLEGDHMIATTSPDGKTITFDFVDARNLLSSQMGHMQHVVFTIIDADHHTELWQFAMADGKTEGGTLDLKRTK